MNSDKKITDNVHFSSEDQTWTTPQEFYDKLNEEFNFSLEPCCSKESAKCEKFFTEEDDGLKQDLSNDVVFMNSPYGREIPQWIEKAHNEYLKGATVVCLIPSRTDTRYWHNWIFPLYYENKIEIRFLKGRLKFGNAKTSAPFPSVVIVYK